MGMPCFLLRKNVPPMLGRWLAGVRLFYCRISVDLPRVQRVKCSKKLCCHHFATASCHIRQPVPNLFIRHGSSQTARSNFLLRWRFYFRDAHVHNAFTNINDPAHNAAARACTCCTLCPLSVSGKRWLEVECIHLPGLGDWQISSSSEAATETPRTHMEWGLIKRRRTGWEGVKQTKIGSWDFQHLLCVISSTHVHKFTCLFLTFSSDYLPSLQEAFPSHFFFCFFSPFSSPPSASLFRFYYLVLLGCLTLLIQAVQSLCVCAFIHIYVGFASMRVFLEALERLQMINGVWGVVKNDSARRHMNQYSYMHRHTLLVQVSC